MRLPPIFWVFNSPSLRPPGADGHHRERRHVGRHCPYTNNIWCGSVQALLRYRSKTAKMQKLPIDSHSNENFICLFFRPPGAANPQTTSFPFMMFALPWAKISRRSHHPALRYPQPYKQTNKKLNITPNATLYGEIIIIIIIIMLMMITTKLATCHFSTWRDGHPILCCFDSARFGATRS